MSVRITIIVSGIVAMFVVASGSCFAVQTEKGPIGKGETAFNIPGKSVDIIKKAALSAANVVAMKNLIEKTEETNAGKIETIVTDQGKMVVNITGGPEGLKIDSPIYADEIYIETLGDISLLGSGSLGYIKSTDLGNKEGYQAGASAQVSSTYTPKTVVIDCPVYAGSIFIDTLGNMSQTGSGSLNHAGNTLVSGSTMTAQMTQIAENIEIPKEPVKKDAAKYDSERLMALKRAKENSDKMKNSLDADEDTEVVREKPYGHGGASLIYQATV